MDQIISSGKHIQKHNNRGGFWYRTVKMFLMLFVIVIALYPILWLLLSSFKTHFEILDSGLSLPTSFKFNGYIYAIEKSPLLTFFFNSVIISSIATLINVFVVSMASYVTARYDFKFKNIVIFLIASTLFLPGVSLFYPIFRFVNALNLYDTKTGLIYVYTALGLPITFFLVRSYFLSISREIDDAASVDGAGFIRIFFSIMLPIARPGIASAAVLQFMGVWNEFFYAMILTTNEKSRTLPVAISYFLGRFTANYQALFAVMMLMILPTIIVFILLQKQVIESLASGAVKG